MIESYTEDEVSRQPIPEYHPKQQLFAESEATQILLGGDTRGGKSAAFKMWLVRMCGMIPGLQCDIFRLHEDDVIAGYMQGSFSLLTLTAQLIKDGLVKHNQTELRFWNGSMISLEHCSTDAAMSKHQGIPKHIRAFDEAGQIPERRMKWLTGWMILNEDEKLLLPPQYREYFPKVIFLSNPIGPSKPYLRKRFVKARPKFEIETVGAWKLQYIPFVVEDNPSEDAEQTRLRVAEISDEATATALLDESKGWDAQTGNYFQSWDSDVNVCKDFLIPDFWLRFRCFDYGSYEPWYCAWFAVSPGVTIHEKTPDERYLPRGCLVAYREWYGCKAEHPTNDADKNITNLAPKNWSNKDIAQGIALRTERRFSEQPTFTDKFPFNNLGGNVIANDFRDCNKDEAGNILKDDDGEPLSPVILTLGDTDRKNGWAQMNSRIIGEELIAGSNRRWPMLVVFEKACPYAQDYIPMIERHPDEGKTWDAQENGEPTHACDTFRIASMAHKVVYDAPVNSKEVIDKTLANPKNTRKSIRDIIPGLDL
jgi:hypothetical protein